MVSETNGQEAKGDRGEDHLRMENAILAGQQKRQGLLLHLCGHDIPNLLSPESEETPVAASNEKWKG